METKSFSQPGYLLCWNALSRLYSAGGAYNLRDFQEVINTLSISKNAKVLVIADACRSGKLSGSGVDGARLTTANLALQSANETKFLSCQANQYSLEGKQWGGGHGAFSYHLIDGLFGMADHNGDGIVTSGELDRYLEDHVIPETQPDAQEPLLVGSKMERLFPVDASVVETLKKNKSGELPLFKPVKVKGLADRVLATVDSSVRQNYLEFKKAIKEKRFFSPAGNCAEDYYQQLIQVEALAPLYGAMKRKYAAGLQDDAQETLNEWLNPKQQANSERLTQNRFNDKVRSFPRCLDRAAELLGENHYMYAALKARKYFFEGFLLSNNSRTPSAVRGEQALALFRQSLAWQPEQPQVFWQMSNVFSFLMPQLDSLEYYAQRAIKANPNWVLPYTYAVTALVGPTFKQYDRARIYLEQATLVDSNSLEILKGWAMYYHNQNRMDEAKQPMLKALAKDSTYIEAWDNLGWISLQTEQYDEAEVYLKKAIGLDSSYIDAWFILGYLYNKTRRFTEAVPVLRKAVMLDSTDVSGWNNLGAALLQTHHLAEAEPPLNRAIALDSMLANPRKHLGMVCFKTSRPEEARQNFLKAIALNPDYANAMLGMAYLLHSEGKTTDALGYVEQAIGKGATFEQLESDEDLAPLRTTPEWKVLMKKYFPDKVKD